MDNLRPLLDVETQEPVDEGGIGYDNYLAGRYDWRVSAKEYQLQPLDENNYELPCGSYRSVLLEDGRCEIFKLAIDKITWTTHSVWDVTHFSEKLAFVGWRSEGRVSASYWFLAGIWGGIYVSLDNLETLQPYKLSGVWDDVPVADLFSYTTGFEMHLTPRSHFMVYATYHEYDPLFNVSRATEAGNANLKWTESQLGNRPLLCRQMMNFRSRIYAIMEGYDSNVVGGKRLLLMYSEDDGLTFSAFESPQFGILRIIKDDKHNRLLCLASNAIYEVSTDNDARLLIPLVDILMAINHYSQFQLQDRYKIRFGFRQSALILGWAVVNERGAQVTNWIECCSFPRKQQLADHKRLVFALLRRHEISADVIGQVVFPFLFGNIANV